MKEEDWRRSVFVRRWETVRGLGPGGVMEGFELVLLLAGASMVFQGGCWVLKVLGVGRGIAEERGVLSPGRSAPDEAALSWSIDLAVDFGRERGAEWFE